MPSLSLCRSFVVSRILKRMSSSQNSYMEAIQKLNSLQSNKSALSQIKEDVKLGRICTNIEKMENYLLRTGVTLSKLDELSVIHVAGTKGKGTTSAMCESILRAHGLRTGLYTSPHLVAVRERVRLDGALVSRDKFASYLHEVFDLLEGSKAYEGDMPQYFAFLTVLAFHMFLKEKVDVAIVEVGIGGSVDNTNVLRKVPVVGISALGLDHVSVLGDTIEQIAAAKAGVMKPGCEAYSVPQPRAAAAVLAHTARAVQCPLYIVPEYESYAFPKDSVVELQVDLPAYRANASLAIQLSHAWLRLNKIQALSRQNIVKKKMLTGKSAVQNGYIEFETYYNKLNEFSDPITVVVPRETAAGLRACRWPGRYQVVRASYANFYLDGAHTKESMEICAKWFSDNNRHQDKMLIFSATGDRDVQILLTPLKNIKFNKVYFVMPKTYKAVNDKNDNFSVLEHYELSQRCHKHSEIWKNITGADGIIPSRIAILECVNDALIDIKRGSNGVDQAVLITGSLHLVGAALSILDPSLSKD